MKDLKKRRNKEEEKNKHNKDKIIIKMNKRIERRGRRKDRQQRDSENNLNENQEYETGIDRHGEKMRYRKEKRKANEK